MFQLFINLRMILVIRQFFHKDYVGLTLWPFIILKEIRLKKDTVLINHERIHLKQQLEMLILPFYMVYLMEWLLRTLRYRDSYKAYQNISFEREAYQNEDNLDYINQRNPFSFIKYL